MNWIMGTSLTENLLNFDSNSLALSSINLDLNLGVTGLVMSNQEGDFIFYSDGIRLHDADDNIMTNGDTLNPCEYVLGVVANCLNCGYTIYFSMIALPFEAENSYAIIHRRYLDSIITTPTTTYFLVPDELLTVVDMNLNGGKGDVTSKNELIIHSKMLDVVAATKHANGRDWWAIIPESSDSLYFKVLLGPDMVPTIDSQVIGIKPPQDSMKFSQGFCVFSPDGSKYVDNDVAFGVKVYDFDRCNGLLSNLKVLPPLDYVSGVNCVAISPNSRYLYVSNAHYVLQYDLEAQDIASTTDTVAVWDGSEDTPGEPSWFRTMTLAPDGKIYITPAHGSVKSLHVINYPNKKGIACDVRQRYVQLPHRKGSEFTLFPNYRLGPLDGSPCDTLGLDNHPLSGFRCETLPGEPLSVEFTDNSFYEPAQWAWDFGDGNASQDTSPVHNFPGPGSYTVCLTVSNAYGSDTWCKVVSIVASGMPVNASPTDKIYLSPNPAKASVNVQIPKNIPQSIFTLFAVTGQPVLTHPLDANWNLVPLASLPPGLYFYEVRDEGKLLQSGKLVKVE